MQVSIRLNKPVHAYVPAENETGVYTPGDAVFLELFTETRRQQAGCETNGDDLVIPGGRCSCIFGGEAAHLALRVRLGLHGQS